MTTVQTTPPAATAPHHAATVARLETRSDKAGRIAASNTAAAVQPSLVSGVIFGVELALLVLTGWALTRFWIGGADTGAYFLPMILGTMLMAIGLQSVGAYRLDTLRRHTVRIGRVMAVWSVVCGGIALVMFVLGIAEGMDRTWFPAWYAAGAVALVGASIGSSQWVKRLTLAGRLQRRAVIVGGGPAAETLIRAIEKTGGNEVRILGIFDDRDEERSPENQAGYPKLGRVDELLEFARVASVDLLIVSIPMSAETRLLQMLKKLWVLPVDIRLAANASKLRLRPRSYSYIGSVPFLDLFDRPIAGWDSVVKRIFDVIFASLAIVALSPVMIGAAIAIRMDSKGPILFRQKRYGFNNEVVSVLKFRSMYHEMSDPDAKRVVTKGDPRVTPVGRIIRKTSIDELPQLFNVLLGNLSLVGPRPHAVNAHTHDRLWEEVVDGYFARHKVKPGVTGWAQINGLRGEVDSPEKIQARVQHDLHYIENWSVLFDLYILFLTPFRILNQENAY
ncbi:undecaprenyl-phosphate glucose phosphotransferase [Chthonobacter albigriseus]|uniref:undecaprenyl-phosphate glucose phosphotransferase n=1 Tax=Chthonobacter albigriseus TaxID=1683161 RepID=UPI0015EF8A8C|nr:undecaprenyl-phosphate glucose phosphotransferase [Chthonobacter albigriseus]